MTSILYGGIDSTIEICNDMPIQVFEPNKASLTQHIGLAIGQSRSLLVVGARWFFGGVLSRSRIFSLISYFQLDDLATVRSVLFLRVPLCGGCRT